MIKFCHRRESGFEGICAALLRIVHEHDVRIVYSVHPNPNVRQPVERLLGANDQITPIDPQDYEPFVFPMPQSYLIITDSSDVQEEAPSLGKPVLVIREKTEPPEAVNVGTVILVGTDTDRIFGETSKLLTNSAHYQAMAINPYGDDLTASRI